MSRILASGYTLLLVVMVALVGCVNSTPVRGETTHSRGAPIRPKVLIISMFTPERDVWLSNMPSLLQKNVSIPGLSPMFPHVHCQRSGQVCIVATGEGQINAAASTMALFLSDRFDLRKTYLLVAGIGGINPNVGTLGSVVFARYAVQASQQYALDAREIPANWTFSFWNYNTKEPNLYPQSTYGTELFALNFPLVDRAFNISRSAASAKLNDSADAQAYRARYDYTTASAAPSIMKGDVTTSDMYFAGRLLGETFGNLTSVLTNGTGTFAVSAQEDNATLESLLRAHLAGKADYGRLILMRTASDMDRAPPGLDEYTAFTSEQGGFAPALANLFIAGSPIVEEIVNNWPLWKAGFKPQGGFYGDIWGTLRK